MFFFSVLCLLCLCERLFICALWSPAGKGLTSWLSFVVSNCEFVTFPLFSLVKHPAAQVKTIGPLIVCAAALIFSKGLMESNL